MSGFLVVGDVFAVVDNPAGGVELLVVRVLYDVAHVDILRQCAVRRGEVQGAFGLGIGGEPVLTVDLLVVRGEGGLEILVTSAGVLRDSPAVDENDLEILLVDPDLALEIMLAFFEGLGAGGKDIRVELIDSLTAKIGDVILGQVFGGEDERETVLNLVEVNRAHEDAFEGILWGENDVFFALTVLVEGDVGDLLVFAIDSVGVFRDGVDFDSLSEGVVFAGLFEDRLSGAEFLDDLLGRRASGRRRVERAEAGGVLGGV